MRRLTTIPLSKPKYTLKAPLFSKMVPKVRTPTISRADWTNSLVETSYFIGKSATLFVMFYTSIQWLYYRNQREAIEEKDKKD